MRHVLFAAALILPAMVSGQQYDHVVVTADSFVSRFTPLGNYVEGSLGLSDTVVATEDIHAQHAGRDSPEKIRNFICHVYQNWGTTHVLLGGDVEIVPHRNVRASRLGRTGDIPCDLYYSALDGDWDANANSVFGETTDCVDLVPDIFIGRVPASTAGQVDTVVSKIVAYCSDSSAPYLSRVLQTGFDLYQNPPIHGEIACEYYDQFLVPAALKPCAKVFDSHTGNHRADVLAALNQGQHVWVHADHGNWDRLGTGIGNHGWVVYGRDLGYLANGTNLCLLLSMACNVGAFDSSDCAAEDLINAPAGGGVGTFTNSQVGTLLGPDWHHTASFLQVEWTLDELFERSGRAALTVLAAVQARVAPLAETSAVYRWCQYSYSLLGEPAMPVWIPEQGGFMERPGDCPAPTNAASFVRGVLFLPEADFTLHSSLFSLSGQKVFDLQAGANNVRSLVPGVYFVREAQAQAIRKVIVTR